eukprot:COSAG06_NODE_4985_length_3806_cov_2.019153_1_plen_68_part_10
MIGLLSLHDEISWANRGSYFDTPHADLGSQLADVALADHPGGRLQAIFCGHVHWEEYRGVGGGLALDT